tara:strand:+ start:483 stop:1346 length:864 start_codon:yes stop_codon:yes gene_type:complete
MNLQEALNEPNLIKIINDIKTASEKISIDFFGLGALARNVWYTENDEPARGTKDIDFGVYVPDDKTYNLLKNLLVSEFDYQESSSNAFCLISPYGTPVDLLPFGEIENQSKVMIDGKGLVSINLDGFTEVYKNGIRTVSIDGSDLKICSIPSMVLLKLIAYDDRPENRDKDPLDIASVLQYYPNLESELIWNEYSFLYEEEEDMEHEEIGIITLGFEISNIIFNNKELIDRVNNILDKAINKDSNIAELMIQDHEKESVELMIDKLKLLKRGIDEGIIKNNESEDSK